MFAALLCFPKNWVWGLSVSFVAGFLCTFSVSCVSSLTITGALILIFVRLTWFSECVGVQHPEEQVQLADSVLIFSVCAREGRTSSSEPRSGWQPDAQSPAHWLPVTHL